MTGYVRTPLGFSGPDDLTRHQWLLRLWFWGLSWSAMAVENAWFHVEPS